MRTPFSQALDKIPPSGIRTFFDLVMESEGIVSLGIGEPDFPAPQHIRDVAIQSLRDAYTSYTSNNGLIRLRHEVSRYLDTRFGGRYAPEDEILITTGVSESADITLRALINPGDEIIVPEPNYVCYAPLIQLAGGKVVSVNTEPNGFIPDPKDFVNAISPNTKAILLCSPCNPTGRIIPKDILEKIIAIANTHDVWVISDEIYAELCYDAPFTSAISIEGAKECCILLSGLSKAFAMTGFRVGYIAGPKPVIERTLKIHQYATLCAPITSQIAACEALKNGLDDVEMMRQSYEKRRNMCIEAFDKMGLEMLNPEGAFYCFPSIKSTGITSEDFCFSLLKEKKVAVVPGTAFGPIGEGYIRCCYAVSEDDLAEALGRIADFTQKLR